MMQAPKTPPVSTGKPSAVANGIARGGDSGSMAKRTSESGCGAQPRCAAFPFPPKNRIPHNVPGWPQHHATARRERKSMPHPACRLIGLLQLCLLPLIALASPPTPWKTDCVGRFNLDLPAQVDVTMPFDVLYRYPNNPSPEPS